MRARRLAPTITVTLTRTLTHSLTRILCLIPTIALTLTRTLFIAGGCDITQVHACTQARPHHYRHPHPQPRSDPLPQPPLARTLFITGGCDYAHADTDGLLVVARVVRVTGSRLVRVTGYDIIGVNARMQALDWAHNAPTEQTTL